MVTMEQVFEAIEESGGTEKLWNELRAMKKAGKLPTSHGKKPVSKKIGPDKYEFQGKKGHWRTVNGNEIFFPDDKSAPMGMPKAMKKAKRKDTSPEGLWNELRKKKAK